MTKIIDITQEGDLSDKTPIELHYFLQEDGSFDISQASVDRWQTVILITKNYTNSHDLIACSDGENMFRLYKGKWNDGVIK